MARSMNTRTICGVAICSAIVTKRNTPRTTTRRRWGRRYVSSSVRHSLHPTVGRRYGVLCWISRRFATIRRSIRRSGAVAKLALDERSALDEGDRVLLDPGDLKLGFVEETAVSELDLPCHP